MRALTALAGLITRSIENPANPIRLADVESASELWSGGDADSPQRIGTALRCGQIIAGTVAGCPIRFPAGEGVADYVPPALTLARAPWSGDGISSSLVRPSLTPFETIEIGVKSMVFHGNAYYLKVRRKGTDDPRFIDALDYINPSRVQVRIESHPDLGLRHVKRFIIDGKVADSYTSHDIFHVPAMLSDDGVTGTSVVGNLRRTFDLTASAERAAERMFTDGLLVSGFLSTEQELTQEQATALKARWKATIGRGSASAGDIGVLDKGGKFEPVTLKPSDAQFLETRKFQTTEIARLFGVPGWMVNDQEKSTSWGSGIESMFTAFVIVTLKSYMQRFEQRLTRELCPEGVKAEFKVEGLLRGDSKSRAAFYASGIQNGWLVPNDVRRLEDMGDVAWGDKPYLPFNTAAGTAPGVDDDTTEDEEE